MRNAIETFPYFFFRVMRGKQIAENIRLLKLFSVISRISRVKEIIILAELLLAVNVQAVTPYYHINRSFSAVEFDIEGIPTVYELNAQAEKLTATVRGDIKLDTNGTYAIEKQAAIPICYPTAQEAWNAALAYNGSQSNYPGKIFDNVGWVRGVKNAEGGWGAYLWVIQNQIAFQSSTSAWWQTTNGVPVAITNVMVGSLGDYGPMSNVVDIGPSLDAATNNFPGANMHGEEKEYQVDISNVYYQLQIPDIWITPRFAMTSVGGSNVQYTVVGTNIPQGVTWAINPDLTDGAEIYPSNDWHYASVTPGNVGTNYKVRATSVDNTNFYDEVSLTVLKLELMEVNFSGTGIQTLKKTGNDTWTNDTYVSEGDITIDNPVWKDINLDGDTEDPEDKNEPVCFTRLSSPTIQAKFKVTPAATMSSIPFFATLQADVSTTLNYSNNVNLSGSEITVTFTTTNHLPDKVSKEDWQIDFVCNMSGVEGLDVGHSEHEAFITYDTPKATYFNISDDNYSPVSMSLTAKRLNIAVEWAEGKNITNDIATACDSGVDATLGFAYNYTNNPFAALDIGGGWDCISWGNIASTACRLLGVEAHPYRAWCRNNIVTTNSSTWGWQVQYQLYHHPGSGETSWFLGYPDNNFQGFFYVGQLDVSGGVFPSDGWSVGHRITAESGKEKYLPIYVIQPFAGVGGGLQWKVADAGGNAPISEWQPNSEISGITINPFPDSSSPDLSDDGTYNINWNISAYTLQFNNGSNITVTANGEYILPSVVHDIRVTVTTNSLPSTNESGNVRVVPPHYLATIP